MEDIENSGVIGIGSGVIVNCEDGKYIGFLQGTDDMYLYLKTTHRWAEKTPEVTEESAEALREVLASRPLWLLRLEVGWRLKMVTIGMPRETAVEILSDYMEQEVINSVGPVYTFLPEAKAVNMGIPHLKIDTFESLQDVVAGTVLSELDFSGIMDNDEDEEDYDDEEDDTDDS